MSELIDEQIRYMRYEHRCDYAFARAVIAADREANGWQDISTAPMEKDVIVWCGNKGMPYQIAGCFNGIWSTFDRPDHHLEPTHWMPLSAAPKEST